MVLYLIPCCRAYWFISKCSASNFPLPFIDLNLCFDCTVFIVFCQKENPLFALITVFKPKWSIFDFGKLGRRTLYGVKWSQMESITWTHRAQIQSVRNYLARCGGQGEPVITPNPHLETRWQSCSITLGLNVKQCSTLALQWSYCLKAPETWVQTRLQMLSA